MQWKNGYLGACIVVLGIIATIIGAYVLSIEVTDEEVTKYSYVADLNGLFDSEQAPSYIEYNPSTNYTGYYTDSSVIGNVKYFDGVDCDITTIPNAYRLNLPMENQDTGTLTLTGSDWKSGAHVSLMALGSFPDNSIARGVWGTGTTGTDATLSSVIETMTLADEINVIQFRSIENKDALAEPYPQADTLELNWVLFSYKDAWYGDALRAFTDECIKQYPEEAQYKQTRIMLGCVVDLSTNLATLYYDSELTNSAGTYNVDDVIVSWGGTGTGRNVLHLGSTVNYTIGTKPAPEYMDIRGGVSVEE